MRVSQMLNAVTGQLKDAGIPSAALDAELLIAGVIGMDRHRLRVADDRELAQTETARIGRLARRRLRFEPMAYILGVKEFYSLEFAVNRNVLIPRPETELLVDMAVYYARQNAAVVDIGTGSGAIAVSIKHTRADLDVHATDLSSKALTVARGNALRILGRNRITFHRGDLFGPLAGMRFDVIVSNPPYIDRTISGSLQKDLAYEPAEALYSGNYGRETVQRIISQAGGSMADGGVLIMEIGSDMKDFAIQTGRAADYAVSVLNDYAGLPRVAILKK